MEYSIEELNQMDSKQLEKVIEKDTENNGELIFALENNLMELLQEQVFESSETFGDLDEETVAERSIRILVESLDFMSMLGAINALNSPKED
ncbi:MAG: hypothetical protein EOO93_09395 [Pedobacter sp.]|nr:MAG: hypothetical protein EOO93_09395 [Pedobacter sp.]